MALDITIFETTSPSRFICFTIPNPSHPHHQLVRVAVLDSPIQSTGSPRVAALFVPNNREHEWIFSTESGHLQLLLSSPGIERLILIGNNPVNGPDSFFNYRKDVINDSAYLEKLEVSFKPLLLALSPKICAHNGISDIPILSYEDNVISSIVLEKCTGIFVGEMLVEDVEIDCDSEKREFRRRLRFKRLPNLVQTEIRMVPVQDYSLDSVKIGGEVEFKPDFRVLEPPYLRAMVASLSLISSHLEERISAKAAPKALCVGVGGGALLSFLRRQLGFEVVGVEMDEGVLRVARQYFGLEESESFRIIVGNAIEWMEKIVNERSGQNLDSVASFESEKDCCSNNLNDVDDYFDVIMVDLDCTNAMNGISAPPLEIVRKHVLLAAKSLLRDFGIFVINVIPLDRSFYDALIHKFRGVFLELYEIDIGNGENYILIGSVSPLISFTDDKESRFITKLRLVISGAYVDLIRKI
ncbi:methyltransferase-like protein 13 [Tripterygium wilfordii]|uniref:Methyltransferase-like protein 13 n=1 Tax=Tripterygium wilfordii TaxID=458696 RepID=A0A7J7C5L6_TRIWF|nr:eEF1A lysine and N-terminal methyltransferase [Tripterygium wilfordii]KAF5729434.1 methyltransferase-like protein 13 [Tripterygium wilfordii]